MSNRETLELIKNSRMSVLPLQSRGDKAKSEILLKYYRLLLLLVVVLWIGRGIAEELPAKVKYVSKSAIYIDVGRLNGVEIGDSGSVFRVSNRIAHLEVIFVADNSSSCKTIDQQAEISVGDSVAMTVSTPIVKQEITKLTEPDRKIESDPQIKTDSELVDRTRKEEPNRFSGRFGAQYFAQDNLDDLDYDFSQPSFLVRAEVENIMGSHHNLSVRMRGRKNIRSRELSDVTTTRWNSRVYELSLVYDNPQTNYTYGAGRIIPSGAGGLGYMDGLTFSYRFNEMNTVGLFGGTEPDGETSRMSNDELKLGTYISYEKGSYRTQRIQSLLSLSGIYYKGQIDREFLYTRNSYSIGSTWSFYQSGELNLNRGWRKDSSATTFQISSFQFSARWKPIRSTSITFGYNNRRSVRTYDNKSIADSLFDDATRQGFRVRSSIRLPLNIRFSLSGNIRTRASDNSSTYSGSTGLNFYDKWITHIKLTTRCSYFSNLYNRGSQCNISLSRSIVSDLDLRIEGGFSEYKLEQAGNQVKNNWVKLDLDYRITKNTYSAISYELNRGGSLKANRLFVDMGVRF